MDMGEIQKKLKEDIALQMYLKRLLRNTEYGQMSFLTYDEKAIRTAYHFASVNVQTFRAKGSDVGAYALLIFGAVNRIREDQYVVDCLKSFCE